MRQPNQQLTRRRVLQLLALAGGVTVLASCGAAPTPTVPPTAPPSAPPATSTPATVAASTAPTATSTVAVSPTVAASPTAAARPASPAAAPASPTAAARPSTSGTPSTAPVDLLRLIEKVPVGIVGANAQNALLFADVARQRHNYGGAALDSLDDFLTLPEDRRSRLSRAFGAIPISSHAGAFIGESFGWRAAIGFDFWQIDHTIAVGPASDFATFSHLVGRLDPVLIAARLGAAGYRPRVYRGTEILDRENITAALAVPDADDFILRTESVVARSGVLIASLDTAGAEAAIDTTPMIPADPDYAILAVAFNGSVGAAFLPAAPRYRPVASGTGTSTTRPAPSVVPYAMALPEYRLAGFALQDRDGQRTLNIALVYESEADAEAAKPILRQRLDEYSLDPRLARDRSALLRDRLALGPPQGILKGNGRAALVQKLTVSDERDSGLWLNMLALADTGFLRER